MTKLQYLAIRKVLDDDIAASKDGAQMLWFVIDALVDHPDNYSNDEQTEILLYAKLLAPSIVKAPNERKSVSNTRKAILAASGVVASVALLAFIYDKD